MKRFVKSSIALFVWVLCLCSNTLSAKQHGFYKMRDAHSEYILRKFVSPLFKTAGLDEKSLKPFIAPSRQFNAYATLDGTMVVFTEVILSLKNVEPLIGILAHETGHIADRDITRNISNALPKVGSIMLMGLAVGAAASAFTKSTELGLASILFTDRAATSTLNAHVLGIEASADQRAYELLKALNWPIHSLTSAMEYMLGHFGSGKTSSGESIPVYLENHPLNADRVNFSKQKEVVQKGRHAKLPDDFKVQYSLLRGRVIGLLEPTQEILALEECGVEELYAKALAYTRLQKKEEAIKYADLLLKKTNNDTYVRVAKSEILANLGENRKAIKLLEEVVKVQKKDPLIWYELAEIYSKLKEYKKAKHALLRVYYSGDDLKFSIEFWKLLIGAYDELGEKDEATLARAELAVLQKEFDEGRELIKTLRKNNKLSKPIEVKIKDLENQIEENEFKVGVL